MLSLFPRARQLPFTVLTLGAIIATGCGGSTTEPKPVPPPTVPVATVTVAAATMPVERTTTTQLTATTKDAAGNVLAGRTITWTSSAPSIASVDASTGVVTAVDRGHATITATSEGKTGTAAFEVIILYRSITAGEGFSCDLGSIGIAACWGTNGYQDGRLGNGPLDNATLNDSPVPVDVLGTVRFTTIASGQRHSCGLAATGAAYCWGSNGGGQLGAAGAPSWAHQPVAVAGGLTFKAITAGMNHSCAITAAGAAYCWGLNGDGELGNGTTTRSDAPVAVSGGINFASISAGTSMGNNSVTCGVATDGKGYCWGSDAYGQIGDGGTVSHQTNDLKLVPTQVSSATTFKSIAVGATHVCGVLTTGQGVCWGDNASNKLGIGISTTEASSPTAITTSQTFQQIEAGYAHTCGVTTAYQLWCWGANVNGESGTYAAIGTSGSTGPALAAPGEWAEVNLGHTAAHTCGISRDRLSVKCFGENNVGQLGNGTTTSVSTTNSAPQLVVSQQPLP